MKLYIVRHAEAEPATRFGPKADRVRALTDNGKRQAESAGAALKMLGVESDEIWTSPLVRAVETSELLAAGLPGETAIKEVTSLGIPGNFSDLRRQLWESQQQSLVLVGHQPFLGECVQYWLSGRAHPGLHVATSSVFSLVAAGFGRAEMELKFVLNDRVTKLICDGTTNDSKGP